MKIINDVDLQANYLTKQYTVLNYEALGSIKDRTHSKSGVLLKKPIPYFALKINPEDYDALIIDEVHKLSKVGKPSPRYKILKEVTGDKPFIAMSGTTLVETPCAVYYQMSISTHTPFPQKNFYRFCDDWCVPTMKKISSDREVNDYTVPKAELMKYIDTFTIYGTQEDAGISADLQSTDKLHYVKLSPYLKTKYNTLQTDRILQLGDDVVVADSIMKLRTSLHQMESSLVIAESGPISLGTTEKIDYLNDNFSMNEDTVILAYYKAEQDLLAKHFPICTVDSVTKKAEGVDYSHAKEFIIYSMGFSGSKGIQVKERIINVNGSNTTTVHCLLVKNGISEQVYKCVLKKVNFNDSTYLPKEV